MSNDKKAPVASIKLRFEKPAEYDGVVIYPKGDHEVPLEHNGIKGWAQRWISRGAVDIKSETAKAEQEAKSLSDKAAEIAAKAQKDADAAKIKVDKIKADAIAKNSAPQTPPAGGNAPAAPTIPEDKKIDGQDGQKSVAAAGSENKQ